MRRINIFERQWIFAQVRRIGIAANPEKVILIEVIQLVRCIGSERVSAGDVIAWLEPADIVSRNTGHVMIVERAPHPSKRANEIVVGVIDSSHSWHGHGDTRHAERHDGLGRGEIVLVLDGSGRAIAYRWSNSKKSLVHQTAIAIGRLS